MDNDKIKTFYEITNDHSEPPQPIIDDGILLDSSLLTVIGKHKSNKSFLAFNLGVAICPAPTNWTRLRVSIVS